MGLPQFVPQSHEITYDPFANLSWPWNWIVPKLIGILWLLVADVLASGGPVGHIGYQVGAYIANSILGNLFGIVLNRIYIKH